MPHHSIYFRTNLLLLLLQETATEEAEESSSNFSSIRMGLQEGSTEPSILLHSSILLLRERFKELHRMREMREKRDLMKLLSQANFGPAAASSRCFFYHDQPRFRDVDEMKTMKNLCSVETEIDTSLHL